jgi:hypothetical protein
MKAQKATIGTAVKQFDDKIRDKVLLTAYVAVTPDGKEPVSVRTYMNHKTPSGSNHAAVWIHTKDGRHTSGTGSAGGYGYHRPSAAVQFALDAAGVKLAQPIDGVGDGAIREAIEAITRAAGYRKFHVVSVGA